MPTALKERNLCLYGAVIMRPITSNNRVRPKSKAAILTASLSALWLAVLAPAAIASTAELSQKPVLLAMMDEMKGSGMASAGGSQMGAAAGGMGGASASGNMGGMDSMCCMGAMGKAPGAGTAMAMPSALPGFPGASHLYHVGAGGFFLDYADKLGLSVEQTAALNGIKQRSLLDQSAAQRKVDEAEQALWTLTAVDQPEIAAIEAKVQEIEKLKSEARIVFVRAVGEAAKLLTVEQRKIVLGMAPMPSGGSAMKAK
jgi:Spy/CpxP family protein refolding chaperone